MYIYIYSICTKIKEHFGINLIWLNDTVLNERGLQRLDKTISELWKLKILLDRFAILNQALETNDSSTYPLFLSGRFLIPCVILENGTLVYDMFAKPKYNCKKLIELN